MEQLCPHRKDFREIGDGFSEMRREISRLVNIGIKTGTLYEQVGIFITALVTNLSIVNDTNLPQFVRFICFIIMKITSNHKT